MQQKQAPRGLDEALKAEKEGAAAVELHMRVAEAIVARRAKDAGVPLMTFGVNPADLELLADSPSLVYRLREPEVGADGHLTGRDPADAPRDPVILGVVLVADDAAERL